MENQELFKSPEQLPDSSQETSQDLKEVSDQVLQDILQADSYEEIQNLAPLFKAYQIKREVARSSALNDVQDALVSQMNERLQKCPNNFSNSDLAVWMKTVQQASEASQKTVSQADNLPEVSYHQTNNTQVNVNIADSLSSESRKKIVNFIQQALQAAEKSDNSEEIIEENSNTTTK